MAAADEPSATSVQKVRAYVEPSVVSVTVAVTGYVNDTFNNTWLGDSEPFELSFSCTGFVVSADGYVATAGHCVDPSELSAAFKRAGWEWAAANGYYKDVTALTFEDVVGDYNVEGLDENDDKLIPDVTVAWSATAGGVAAQKKFRARVVSSEPLRRGDQALLKINANGLIPVALAPRDPSVGNDVVSIGFPGSVDEVVDRDLAPSFKDGTVSGKSTLDGGIVPTYELSAAMSGGMSGGPTVNLKYQVIGTNSWGPTGETQQFNFIEPVSLLREAVQAAGVNPKPGANGREYKAGLDAYFDGNKSSAVEHLQKVVDEQPSNAFAQDYLRKAKRLKASVMPRVLLFGAVSLLGAGAIAAAFVAVRRRRTRDVMPSTSVAAPVVAAPAALAAPAPTPTAGPVSEPASGDNLGDAEFCTSCGQSLSPGTKFCSHCGAPAHVAD